MTAFLGPDVVKQEPSLPRVGLRGDRFHAKRLPQDGARLRELFGKLRPDARRSRPFRHHWRPAGHRRTRHRCGRGAPVQGGNRCIGDMQPGNAKTDARDAYIIAEAVRSMPTRDVPRRRG